MMVTKAKRTFHHGNSLAKVVSDPDPCLIIVQFEDDGLN